jgi:hypothetical protein
MVQSQPSQNKKQMAGFATGKDQERKRSQTIKQFFERDRRFRDKTPEESARFCRKMDPAKSRIETLHLPISESDLFSPVESLQVRRLTEQNDEGTGFEMCIGYWVVRVAEYRTILGSKVPDWEIELLIGRHSRMVFPAVIRERVIRHLGEAIYEKWKAEVLSTEGDLRRLLTEACSRMRQPMAASWITSPSSERLLKRMGIPMEREWAFLFQGQEFE